MLTFKYCSDNRTSFFTDRRLRFSQPSALNDPHECRPSVENSSGEEIIEGVKTRIGSTFNESIRTALLHLNLTEEEIQRRIDLGVANFTKDLEDSAYKSLLADRWLDKLRRRFDESIVILSLSKSWDIPLLWAHYANSHKGFVVGLDATSSFFQRAAGEETDIGYLKDVKYVDRLPSLSLKDIKISPELAYSKQSEWAYEQEQRLIRKPASGLDTGKTDDKGLPIITFEVPIEAIQEITFGISASTQLIASAKNLQGSSGGKITLYKTKITPFTGALERQII